jgi:unsaturated rhamnogalacturonyl hydrolase
MRSCLLFLALPCLAVNIDSAIGVTRKGTPIRSVLTADNFDYNTRKTRVLLVGGLDGSPTSATAVTDAVKWFDTSSDAKRWRRDYAVSAVPNANPDGVAAAKYPPDGDYYTSPTNPEAQYLWRWIGMHAPDVVVVIGQSNGLVDALMRVAPSGTGTIPAIEKPPAPGFLKSLLPTLKREPSTARREIQRRLARTALEIAKQLAVVYGHDFNEPVYIPGMALLGRLKLGDLTKDTSALADIERIVEPYFTGAKPALAKPTGSHLSGHLVFGELAERTKKSRYLELTKAAAELGFDEQGRARESMPMHSEMSDAVFMGCPILARAGRLTGDRKYYDQALRHMRFMLKLNLRADGLHRHSPLDDAAWGRGNGFPALGLALSLTDLPRDYPDQAEMLKVFQAHMNALLPHQDPTGMWRQVIDRPESYRELTATAMIAFSMLRGVRNGWLDAKKFRPAIDRAWYALKTRIAPDGSLVDVCTGTGKQRSLRDYYDRPAILGRDPRGGAMALLIATELAAER